MLFSLCKRTNWKFSIGTSLEAIERLRSSLHKDTNLTGKTLLLPMKCAQWRGLHLKFLKLEHKINGPGVVCTEGHSGVAGLNGEHSDKYRVHSHPEPCFSYCALPVCQRNSNLYFAHGLPRFTFSSLFMRCLQINCQNLFPQKFEDSSWVFRKKYEQGKHEAGVIYFTLRWTTDSCVFTAQRAKRFISANICWLLGAQRNSINIHFHVKHPHPSLNECLGSFLKEF